MKLFTSILTLSYIAGICLAQGGECPEGWTKLHDENCYLLISSYSTYPAAKEACAGRGGTLAAIKEEAQQTFLTNFIFNISEVQLGVWIGATRAPDSATEFRWEDNTSLEYSNWDVDSPSDVIGRDCVIMQSRFSKMSPATVEDGKWKDVSCTMANYFVCETVPDWSIGDIKRVLIETRKVLEKTVEKLDNTTQSLQSTAAVLATTRTELASEKSKIASLQSNPVPVGFIYIEYHGQPAPRTIWPGVTWTDVTSTYAGLFFRAFGGGSAAFGSIQNGDSQRLAQLEVRNNQEPHEWNAVVGITPGTWSAWIYSGRANDGSHYSTYRFNVSNSEVRPKNAAIRIWKREA